MRKEQYIRRIMTLYKHYEMNNSSKEILAETLPSRPQVNWKELVEFAADQGLDNLEVQDLIRMADMAKEVLRDKSL